MVSRRGDPRADRRHQARTSSYWATPQAWALVALAGAATVILIMLALLVLRGVSRPSHVPLPTVGVVAAMVGVVGAVGGLIVGVLALVTLFQVDARVRAEFQAQLTQYEQVRDQQSAVWATGLRLWTRALIEQNLTAAQAHLDQALEAWPHAPGARTEMARRLWAAAHLAHIFWLKPYRKSETSPHLNHHPVPIPQPVTPTDLLRWWTRAVETEATDTAELPRIGVGVFALVGDEEQMLRCLSEARKRDGTFAPTDRELLVWAAAWHDSDAVAKAQKVLGSMCSIETLPDALLTEAEGLHTWAVVDRRRQALGQRAVTLIRVSLMSGVERWTCQPFYDSETPADTEPLEELSQTELLQKVADYILIREVPAAF